VKMMLILVISQTRTNLMQHAAWSVDLFVCNTTCCCFSFPTSIPIFRQHLKICLLLIGQFLYIYHDPIIVILMFYSEADDELMMLMMIMTTADAAIFVC